MRTSTEHQQTGGEGSDRAGIGYDGTPRGQRQGSGGDYESRLTFPDLRSTSCNTSIYYPFTTSSIFLAILAETTYTTLDDRSYACSAYPGRARADPFSACEE